MSLLSSLFNNVMGQTVSDTKSVHGIVIQDHEPVSNVNRKSQNDSGPEASTASHQEGASSREPLEWKFIDFTKAKRSPIFDVDPMLLKKFIGHNVTLYSISGQEFNGCCLAIDPVSLSVILAKRVADGKIRITTVPGYYLSRIRVDSNSVPAANSVSVNDLDVAELYHAPTLYTENKSANTQQQTINVHDETENNEGSSTTVSLESRVTPKAASQNIEDVSPKNVLITFTQDEILKRKEELVDLLRKHRMPVIIREDILEIPGGVKITPPYTLECCDTSNQMIKKKLGELIKSL